MSANYCPRCNQPIGLARGFCPHCGLNLTDSAQQASPQVAPQSGNYEQPVQSPVMQATQNSFTATEPAGASSNVPPTNNYTSPLPGQTPPPVTLAKKKSHKGLIIAIVAVVIIAAVAVCAYFFVLNSDDDSSSSNSSGSSSSQKENEPDSPEKDEAETPEEEKEEETTNDASHFFRDIDWSLTIEDLKDNEDFEYDSTDGDTSFFSIQGFDDITDEKVSVLCTSPDGTNIESYFVSFDYEDDEDIMEKLADIYGDFEESSSSSSSKFYMNYYDENTTISTSGTSMGPYVSIYFRNANYEESSNDADRTEGAFYISDIEWGKDKDWAKEKFGDNFNNEDGYNLWFEFDGLESVYSGKTEVLLNFDDDGNTALCGVGIWFPYTETLLDEVVEYYDAEYNSKYDRYITTKGDKFIAIEKSDDRIFVGVIID